jgi:type I restriction enzyme S subunit
MSRLITILTQQLRKSNAISDGIKENLERLGSVRDIQEFIKQSTQKQNTEWRTVKLGDVADVSWGDTNVTKASYVASGFPAYSASGSDGFLPYADFDRTGIVLSAIGAECGKTWLAKGKWSCIKNTLRFWSTDPNVETEYLYWVTRNPVIWPKRGSAQPFISQGDARAMEIRIPSLAEQRAVLSILGSINDKIELDRQMNQTLEQTAQALFQSWVATDLGIES